MIEIHAIAALTDNYIWAIVNWDSRQAILIDVGDVMPALQFLQAHKVQLSAIWITHHHHDHIGGVDELLAAYPAAKLYAHATHGVNHHDRQLVDEGDCLDCFGHQVMVWQTLGHTDSHLSYVLDYQNKKHVFCGDTLFRAGCGRVFTGTIEQLFASFEKLLDLPDTTLFYPAHEYTLSNLAFAKACEPDNQAIDYAIAQDTQKRQNNEPTLPTSLVDEKQINPFVRALGEDTAALIHTIWQKTATAPKDKLALFAKLRALKDDF